jgi:alanine racemase
MDTVTVDVSRVRAAVLQPGTFFDVIDEVNDINTVAAQAGTGPYEILTQLGPRYEHRYLGSTAGNPA